MFVMGACCFSSQYSIVYMEIIWSVYAAIHLRYLIYDYVPQGINIINYEYYHSYTFYLRYHCLYIRTRSESLTHIHTRERERYVLFNDAHNTFYLRLYGVRYMVNDHSDSEKGNTLPPHRLLLSINSKGSFICTIPQTG